MTESTKNATQVEDVKSWVTWTHFFAIADGVARSIYTLINTGKISVASDLKVELMATLKGLHAALKDIDNAFIEVINAMEKGQKPGVVIQPAPIPDWGDDSEDQDLQLLKSGWEIVKPAINLLVQELQKGKQDDPQIEKVITAFSALANASDNIIEAVGKVLSRPKVNS